MRNPNFLQSYPEHLAHLRAEMPEQKALEQAVGGDFLTVGKLERDFLISAGLQPGDFVVDVGCGSGRLALQLSGIAGLRYLGTDILPELLRHAEQLCHRPDWSFAVTDGSAIPCRNACADIVCFFSVFTHLTHEDSFRYLREPKRVAKPGALIVFSFLEFRIESHWAIFDGSLRNNRPGTHLDQFMDREGVASWSRHLDLEIVAFHDGDKPHIPLAEDVRWENGTVMCGTGNLGQSIAVLRVPPRSAASAEAPTFTII